MKVSTERCASLAPGLAVLQIWATDRGRLSLGCGTRRHEGACPGHWYHIPMQKPILGDQRRRSFPGVRARPAQDLRRRRSRGRHRFHAACGVRHRPARRQWRRQDHHHLHAHGPRGADLGRGARVRRRHGEGAPQGPAPHELREPLRRRAHAAHRAAEPGGVRQALRLARPQGRRGRGRAWSSGLPICSTGPTASSPRARRPGSVSPRR